MTPDKKEISCKNVPSTARKIQQNKLKFSQIICFWKLYVRVSVELHFLKISSCKRFGVAVKDYRQSKLYKLYHHKRVSTLKTDICKRKAGADCKVEKDFVKQMRRCGSTNKVFTSWSSSLCELKGTVMFPSFHTLLSTDSVFLKCVLRIATGFCWWKIL